MPQSIETAPGVLTILETALELRTSKSHVSNILNGRVRNLPPLPHLKLGRRTLIQRSSLEKWKALVENQASALR